MQTREREEGFQVGNERRKEDETRWKGYATHLPTSIYCDRADYICGRRYIRGESPFNWSPPRIDHADHPFPDPTVFIRRSCRYAVASWFADHSDKGIIISSSRGTTTVFKQEFILFSKPMLGDVSFFLSFNPDAEGKEKKVKEQFCCARTRKTSKSNCREIVELF